MTIRFHCSDCGVSIKAPPNRSGAQLPCPKCGAQLTVPSAAPSGSDKDDEAAQFANLVAAMEATPSPTPAPPSDNPKDAAAAVPTAAPRPRTPAPRPDEPVAALPAQPAAPRPDSSDGSVDESSRIPPPAPSVTYEPAGKGQVRIVDIKLPFASVLRLGIQFWLVGLLGAFVFWALLFILAVVASAIGVSLSFS